MCVYVCNSGFVIYKHVLLYLIENWVAKQEVNMDNGYIHIHTLHVSCRCI